MHCCHWVQALQDDIQQPHPGSPSCLVQSLRLVDLKHSYLEKTAPHRTCCYLNFLVDLLPWLFCSKTDPHSPLLVEGHVGAVIHANRAAIKENYLEQWQPGFWRTTWSKQSYEEHRSRGLQHKRAHATSCTIFGEEGYILSETLLTCSQIQPWPVTAVAAECHGTVLHSHTQALPPSFLMATACELAAPPAYVDGSAGPSIASPTTTCYPLHNPIWSKSTQTHTQVFSQRGTYHITKLPGFLGHKHHLILPNSMLHLLYLFLWQEFESCTSERSKCDSGNKFLHTTRRKPNESAHHSLSAIR
jgi:hypothetical protein